MNIEYTLLISLFCQIFIFITFFYSFISKSKDIGSLTITISQLSIIPILHPKFISYSVISVEIFIVILLLGGRVLEGLVVALLSLIVFTTVLVLMIRKKSEFNCNCFGKNHTTSVSKTTIVRNIGFIIICIIGISVQIITQNNLHVIQPSFGINLLVTSLSLLSAMFWMHIEHFVELLFYGVN